MSRNSAGIPEPFDWGFWWTVAQLALLFVGLPLFTIWWVFFSPCSWHGFESVQNLPSRCIRQTLGS